MKDKSKKLLDITFWKFILVGIANTIVGTTVMFVAYNIFHRSYWVSSALNYVIGSILSYFLNKYFTFQDKKKSWKQIIAFAANITVCYLMAYGFAKPIVFYVMEGYGKVIQENIAMLVGMGVFVVLNYLGQRLVVFKRKK